MNKIIKMKSMPLVTFFQLDSYDPCKTGRVKHLESLIQSLYKIFPNLQHLDLPCHDFYLENLKFGVEKLNKLRRLRLFTGEHNLTTIKSQLLSWCKQKDIYLLWTFCCTANGEEEKFYFSSWGHEINIHQIWRPISDHENYGI